LLQEFYYYWITLEPHGLLSFDFLLSLFCILADWEIRLNHFENIFSLIECYASQQPGLAVFLWAKSVVFTLILESDEIIKDRCLEPLSTVDSKGRCVHESESSRVRKLFSGPPLCHIIDALFWERMEHHQKWYNLNVFPAIP